MTDQTGKLLMSGSFGDPEPIREDMAQVLSGMESTITAVTGERLSRASGAETLESESIRKNTILTVFRHLCVDQDTEAAGATISAAARILASENSDTSVEVRDRSYRLAGSWDHTEPGRHLARIVSDDLAPAEPRYQAADSRHVAAVDRAIDTLQQAVPGMGETTLAFVSGAVLVDTGRIASAFVSSVPQVSVLDIAVLDDPAAAADVMLHEAAHQKFYDICATRPIVEAGAEGLRFEIPWTPVDGKRRTMSELRILSTLHVYVHLLYLQRRIYLLDLMGTDRRVEQRDRIRKYVDRAEFFHAILRNAGSRFSLGADGREFAEWLSETMSANLRALADLDLHGNGAYIEDAVRQTEKLGTAP